MFLSRPGGAEAFRRAACFGLLFALDQGLKAACTARLGLVEQAEILGQSILQFTRILNRGIALGKFSMIPEGHVEPYVFYGPALILAAAAIGIALRWQSAGRIEHAAALAFLAGGASNLLSYAIHGHVTDTLMIAVSARKWVPFNLADVWIVAGATAYAAVLTGEIHRALYPRRKLSTCNPPSSARP